MRSLTVQWRAFVKNHAPNVSTPKGQGKERSHTRKGTGLSVSNGYGNAQRPSSKGGSTGGCDDNDEEEDLPEELKRFGKELVEKIESEIMDRGEPITFDDIAGLEDAKQTVQEVVCWPMRRPDIFTGLRRAPNGLLLFGPPGTGKVRSNLKNFLLDPCCYE